jgi:hypothetical protein
MYFASVLLLLLIFPVASIAIEAAAANHAAGLIFLMGKWFVFWAAGIRLFIAGLRQAIQPEFTLREIFGITDRAPFPIVRELGFANLSMGLLGICSVFRNDWIVPGAMVGGLYYGLAGAGHIFQGHKNSKEYVAMISDVWAFLVLTGYALHSLV